jgi:rubrerythrin
LLQANKNSIIAYSVEDEMDIFEFAMQMEKDGESYYREIAAGIDSTGIKKILSILADEEVKHFEVFAEMKRRTPDLPRTTTLKDVKNVFAQMKESGENIGSKLGQVELYKKAQELEKKSEDFYLEKSEEMDSDAQKELMLKIADEENKHYMILEHVIQFVTRTDHYLEDAEFENLEPL